MNKLIIIALALSLAACGHSKKKDVYKRQELKRYIGHLRQELSEDPALSIENKHGGYYKLQGE